MKLNELNPKVIQDKESFQALKHLGLPTKHHEDYRNIDLSSLYEEEFDLCESLLVQDLKHKAQHDDFYYLYIINDKSIVHYSDLPQGVEISNDSKENLDSKNAFFHLSESFLENRMQLNISKMLDKPLVLLNIFTQDQTFYPNSLHINIQKNLTVEIVDVYLNQSQYSFANINRYFDLKDNAQLKYYKVQDMNESKLFVNNIASLQSKAHLEVLNIDQSDSFHLNHWETTLTHDNSSFVFNGLGQLHDHATLANIVTTVHEASHTTSDIHIRHILHEHSKAIFEVMSIVQKDATFTQAYQNCHTVLMSDDAVIFAKPHLEILTDELKASHGATTGSLDKEQLLYLQSRGIEEENAKALLLKAFGAAIYDKISSPIIKTFILNLKRSSYV